MPSWSDGDRRHEYADPRSSRRAAVLYLILVVAPFAAFYAAHSSSGYWVGLAKNHLVVFHGGLGTRWDIAARTGYQYELIPDQLRSAVLHGIPVLDVGDGIRLTDALASDTWTPTKVRNAILSGVAMSPGSCFTQSDFEPVDCDKPHATEILDMIASPFRLDPGMNVMRDFAKWKCPGHQELLLADLWTFATQDGYQAVVCLWSSYSWTMRGFFPEISYFATGAAIAGSDWRWYTESSGRDVWSFDWTGATNEFSMNVEIGPAPWALEINCLTTSTGHFALRVNSRGELYWAWQRSTHSTVLAHRRISMDVSAHFRVSGKCEGGTKGGRTVLHAVVVRGPEAIAVDALESDYVPSAGGIEIVVAQMEDAPVGATITSAWFAIGPPAV